MFDIIRWFVCRRGRLQDFYDEYCTLLTVKTGEKTGKILATLTRCAYNAGAM